MHEKTLLRYILLFEDCKIFFVPVTSILKVKVQCFYWNHRRYPPVMKCLLLLIAAATNHHIYPQSPLLLVEDAMYRNIIRQIFILLEGLRPFMATKKLLCGFSWHKNHCFLLLTRKKLINYTFNNIWQHND